MKFSASLLKKLFAEDLDDNDCIQYIDETDWLDEGKYQIKNVIFIYEKKYYMTILSRTGSYYSDYYYNIEDWSKDELIECPEVEKIMITISKWELVSKE